MTAAAHQHVDEPQDDPAEAAMSEADFRISERVHEICGHAAARELPAEVTKAPGSLRYAAICMSLCAELNEGALLRDLETETEPTDWKEVAQTAWHEGWAAAAVEYQVTRRNAYAWVRR
jgi:hypothetical protein